jgi:pilus assembly protein CpaF
MSAQQILEAEVRELVRTRGIDPMTEADAVAGLIEEAVADYLDRAVTSSLPALTDAAGATRSVLDSVAGFGPLQVFLDDPTVDDYRAVP